jgi:hypothetical protein
MLTPRGPLPPKVYWRRRALLAAAAVLAVVTVVVLLFGGGGDDGGGADLDAQSPDGPSRSAPSATDDRQSSSSSSTRSPGGPASSGTQSGAGSTAGSTEADGSAGTSAAAPRAESGPNAPVGACGPEALSIGAATDAASYPVSATPALRIVVTNISAAPCTVDLSDEQIELFVYFGEARIWGSHDCSIQPGSAVQTLPVGQPVMREIVWTGLSSEPGCAATRQRVAAGTYTLRPTLSGIAGSPVTFSFV